MSDVRRPVTGDPIDAVLAELVSGVPGASVVDVGGGSGTHAVPLACLGCRVTVIDSSVNALAILHRRAQDAGVGDLVTGIQVDADQVGTVVPPGGADLVLCHHLLETVDDPTAVVAALASVVRPGGQVSVLVTSRLGAVVRQILAGRYAAAGSILTDPDGRLGGSDPLNRRFEPTALADLLTHVGLQVGPVVGIGVVAGLVAGGSRPPSTGTDIELADLEILASAHRTLRDLAPELHVLARRPGPVG